MLAAAIGVAGVFWLIGALGIVALGLVLFVLPAERPRAERATRGHWRQALTRRLAPYYAGIFVLHLTLTAAFIAVPHVLRDLHGLEESRHWMVYLGVFVASIALTAPLVIWSERNRSPGRAALIGGAGLAVALAALVRRAGESSMRCSARWCSISAPSISSRRACRRP